MTPPSSCFDARQKFTKGDRVRATEAAFKNGCFINIRDAEPGKVFGTVVGFGDEGYCVRILRDGRKRPDLWSPNFWEVLSSFNVTKE